ncbi:MAG: UDP-N-acetylglucosamine 1-carboxyvinyltransferase [Candidatus Kerfeldbacteria bacterium]|nr:UDP-N-acetylglucosamine 1-carboxyvinyltransferase [Candidatus Kerfeldbacteria bacterium]
MAQQFRIQGGKALSGVIEARGAKNAAACIIPAATLTQGTSILHNVPNILDVRRLVDVYSALGVHVTWKDEHTLEISGSDLDITKLDTETVRKMRMSSYLFSTVTPRVGEMSMPLPGGDKIGARPIDAHFLALEKLGMQITGSGEFYTLRADHLHGGEVVMTEMSVTGTANVILTAAQIPDTTVIHNAASEPYIQDLCRFLQKTGVAIEGIGTHDVTVTGASTLHAAEHTIMPDHIEGGTFVALAAATHSSLIIQNIVPAFSRLECAKFDEAGVDFSFTNERNDPDGQYTITDCVVKPAELRGVSKLNSMPYPGCSPDLLPPLAVMLTQARGTSLIHEWMYEGRQKYLEELVRMGANITICDPHRALIVGPTPLTGTEIMGFDIRSGATMIIAALVAKRESCILNIEQIDRGYEKIEERLQALGASIIRENI